MSSEVSQTVVHRQLLERHIVPQSLIFDGGGSGEEDSGRVLVRGFEGRLLQLKDREHTAIISNSSCPVFQQQVCLVFTHSYRCLVFKTSL